MCKHLKFLAMFCLYTFSYVVGRQKLEAGAQIILMIECRLASSKPTKWCSSHLFVVIYILEISCLCLSLILFYFLVSAEVPWFGIFLFFHLLEIKWSIFRSQRGNDKQINNQISLLGCGLGSGSAAQIIIINWLYR